MNITKEFYEERGVWLYSATRLINGNVWGFNQYYAVDCGISEADFMVIANNAFIRREEMEARGTLHG